MAAMAQLDDAQARLETCDADPEMVELATRCLMPAPAARPRSAEAVARAVHDHLAAVEARVHEARVEAAEAKVRAASLKRTQKLGMALTAVIAAGLLVSLWYWAGGQDRGRERARRPRRGGGLGHRGPRERRGRPARARARRGDQEPDHGDAGERDARACQVRRHRAARGHPGEGVGEAGGGCDPGRARRRGAARPDGGGVLVTRSLPGSRAAPAGRTRAPRALAGRRAPGNALVHEQTGGPLLLAGTLPRGRVTVPRDLGARAPRAGRRAPEYARVHDEPGGPLQETRAATSRPSRSISRCWRPNAACWATSTRSPSAP